MRSPLELGRHLRLLLATGVLALAGAACSRSASQPSFVLITLDTTRADYLSCYGNADARTPRLDELARTGTRFDLAIATAALTPVSHASILTGLQNQDHGLRVLAGAGGFRLRADAPTLATVLKSEGYHTAAYHSAYPVSAHFGLERGFDVFESFTADAKTANDKTWAIDALQRRSDQTTEMALAYMEKARDPYFLWVHYWDPHDPLRIPPHEFLPAGLPQENGKLLPSKELYAAEVRFMDHQIGRLLDQLAASGRADETLVVVVSDHGEGLGDHGWQFHRILYQEQIRVPLLVRAPQAAKAHPVREVKDVVSTVDVFATALDYLGIERATPSSGRSLRALMEGKPDAPRLAFADQINGYDFNARMVENRPLDDFMYCAMDREWKLIYRPAHAAASELYHIASDPRELKNVFAPDDAHAQRLLTALADANPWVTEPFAPIAGAVDHSASQNALESLGYAGNDEASSSEADAWQWTCAVHPDVRSDTRASCPQCGGRPVLVGRAR
ncbi:MAG: sulfatase-like hydrolase/transferase [Planctomycetota bacterium]